jgi:cyclic pyranopterin phosphate synthase
MPADVFGPGYSFLPRNEILSFEEIVQVVRSVCPLGVRRFRLTGGEPLLRRGIDDLVGMLSAVEGVEDLSMTTNGVLLSHHAESLVLAGLKRVTVSLDAMDPMIFSAMNGVGAKVERVLLGISTARAHGLPVKVNCVVQRGVNDTEILPMARWAASQGLTLRFIEYMDVGETNSWRHEHVVSAQTILATLRREFRLVPLEAGHPGETAMRFQFGDGPAEIGLIASVTMPFCCGCSRLRLSADGRLFTCLFSAKGHDIRAMLRDGASHAELRSFIVGLWRERDDRYSELRGTTVRPKAEMSYLGG